DEAVSQRLHQRLVDVANAAGLREVAYRTIETPVGTLLLAATARGLVRVAYASEDHDLVLERLARDVSPRILRAPARLDGVAREIEEYFARRRSTFDVPLDLQLSHGFRRRVLSHLPEIGYGKTASYAAVAKAPGRPPGHRAWRVRQEPRVLRRRADRHRGRVPAMRRVPARHPRAMEGTQDLRAGSSRRAGRESCVTRRGELAPELRIGHRRWRQ